MKKNISVVLVTLFLMTSCATLGTSTPSNTTLDNVGVYFTTFIQGVEISLPFLKVYFPAYAETIDKTLTPIVNLAMTGVIAYQDAVELYKAGKVDLASVLAKQDTIYNLIQAINVIVGQIKGLTTTTTTVTG